MANPETKKIHVTREFDDAVLRISLATPPGNILDAATMAEITACLKQHANDNNIKAIVFEAQGKHFSFGASVEEHQKDQAPKMIRDFHGLFKTLLSTGFVTIAVVQGQCLGGAMELVSFCNFIFCDETAKFGQPEIQLGVFPPVAAVLLPGVIGQLRADDLVLTGRTIDATTAQSWGLVHQVCQNPKEDLASFLERTILPKSAESLRHANKAVRRDWYRQLAAKLDLMETAYVQELMETEDANEGIRSFLEKRKPAWKNR